MPKIYTPEEIDNINLGRKAIFGNVYEDTRGYKFQGVEEGRLILLKKASQTIYNPPKSDLINTNVQVKIENFESETKNSLTELENNIKKVKRSAIAYSIALGGI